MNNVKQTLIEKLLNEKAENNTIDLSVYAIGLSDMYDALEENIESVL